MEAPGPGEADPTAVQCIVSAHAMAVKSVTVDGAYSTVQEAPPFVVPRMLGEFGPEAKSLTARQSEGLGHATAVRMPIPTGIDSVDQLEPPLMVPIISGLPNMPNPAAVQTEIVGQEMPFRPLI
jgi:hypothetical protein